MTRPQPRFRLRATTRVVPALLFGLACAHMPVHAAELRALDAVPTQSYELAGGPLGRALSAFAVRAGIALSFDPALTEGLSSPAVSGTYAAPDALARLLAGSGLELLRRGDGSYGLRKAAAPASSTPAPNAPRSEALLPVATARATPERAGGPVQGYVATRSATASKTDTPIIETPQSVTVVSAERIETMAATNLKDVLAYTPGVDVAPYGTDSRYDWITIRGFEAYSPGFYQDGLQWRNNAWWAVWQTENYGLERIEIMRGPTSVLYGQNGPGGMLNLVSKQPTAERQNEVRLQVGSDARKQLAADMSGALDQEDKLLYRVVGLARDAELPSGSMPDDRLYLAPSLSWQPSTDTRLTLLSHVLRTRAGVYLRSLPKEGTLLPTLAGTHIPQEVDVGEPDFNRLDQDQWSLGYLFEHRVNDIWSVRQNLRYAELDVDYQQAYQAGYLTQNAADPSDPANYRILQRTGGGSQESIRAFTLDNQVQAQVRTGPVAHTLLAGLDYQRSRYDQRSFYSATVADLDLYNPVYGQPVTPGGTDVDTLTTLTQSGLYLQEQARIGSWALTLAGRYDSAKVATDDRLASSRSEQTDNALTGRAGVVYLHPSGWAPYASYATSFSPNTAVNPDTGKPFDPETGRQMELGVRYQPAGYKATYSAALFDLRRRDYITYEPGTFAAKQNGEVVVRGLELEAVVSPLAGLNLTAAYAFTPKADVTKSADPEQIGKQASAVPRHRLSLWGDYRFPFGLKFGLGLRYNGETRGINESVDSGVPDYTLVDAMLGYDLGRWSLALNLQNLTDKTYITSCSGNNCYLGNQRQALLTAAYRW